MYILNITLLIQPVYLHDCTHRAKHGETEVTYPDSYEHNSAKEKHILECVDNFRRQYMYIYPDRKPLLLRPFNECRVEVTCFQTI